MAKNKHFPKHLHVTIETDGNSDDTWLNAAKTTDQIEDGQHVAIYKLVEIRTMRVTRELE
jgi:hypothetical protein